MVSCRTSLSSCKACVLAIAAMLVMSNGWARAQESPSAGEAPQSQAPAPVERAPVPVERAPVAQAPADALQEQAAPEPPPPPYDKSIFLKPIPSDQLASLVQFAGVPSGDAVKDKQLKKAMNSIVPDPMFHYGKDMPLADAMDIVLRGSKIPVLVRDGRYVIVSGNSGPYLGGKGFVWIDIQDGVGVGAFYFHPTNGEPTPTLTVFSRQIKEATIGSSQLPPAFMEDLSAWSRQMNVPQVETRYFIGDNRKRLLLEHDEDYCAPADGAVMDKTECEQTMADAADSDMTAAGYLEQVHYATNATAQMMSNPDQIVWVQTRERACGIGPGRVVCRIRMAHERTRVIQHRAVSHPAPHSSGAHR